MGLPHVLLEDVGRIPGTIKAKVIALERKAIKKVTRMMTSGRRQLQQGNELWETISASQYTAYVNTCNDILKKYQRVYYGPYQIWRYWTWTFSLSTPKYAIALNMPQMWLGTATKGAGRPRIVLTTSNKACFSKMGSDDSIKYRLPKVPNRVAGFVAYFNIIPAPDGTAKETDLPRKRGALTKTWLLSPSPLFDVNICSTTGVPVGQVMPILLTL